MKTFTLGLLKAQADVQQQRYADALMQDDAPCRLEAARKLYQIYQQLGESRLAALWTEEYIQCWLNRYDGPSPDDPVENPLTPGAGTLFRVEEGVPVKG